eukprot:12591073-Prorocentrum_lima.AAC.1
MFACRSSIVFFFAAVKFSSKTNRKVPRRTWSVCELPFARTPSPFAAAGFFCLLKDHDLDACSSVSE